MCSMRHCVLLRAVQQHKREGVASAAAAMRNGIKSAASEKQKRKLEEHGGGAADWCRRRKCVQPVGAGTAVRLVTSRYCALGNWSRSLTATVQVVRLGVPIRLLQGGSPAQARGVSRMYTCGSSDLRLVGAVGPSSRVHIEKPSWLGCTPVQWGQRAGGSDSQGMWLGWVFS